MLNIHTLPYVKLMNDAISGHISLVEFSSSYNELFYVEKYEYEPYIYDLLNSIFLDANEYTPSTDDSYTILKDEFPNFVIGDDEFMERIKIVLEKLCAAPSASDSE